MRHNLTRFQGYAIRFQRELKERGFHAKYKAGNIWIDYGADWRDNSILFHLQNENSFQTLFPKDIGEAKENKFADRNLCRILDKYVNMVGERRRSNLCKISLFPR